MTIGKYRVVIDGEMLGVSTVNVTTAMADVSGPYPLSLPIYMSYVLKQNTVEKASSQSMSTLPRQ